MTRVVRYTFGDDEPAVHRLALVGHAYEPASRSFLERHAPIDAPVALDLGCGPGFSTALIAQTCRPRVLVGLDSSDQFLRTAAARVPSARFEHHDVTVLPLPAAPADLIYARLVLAHLPEPAAIVERWRQQLAPGGVLLSEELETIEAPPGPLQDYDRLSAEIVTRAGGVMYAGPSLAHLDGRCDRVTVSAALAATIYSFNVRLWFAQRPANVAEHDLTELERGLAGVAGQPDGDTVTWVVRQTVVVGSR